MAAQPSGVSTTPPSLVSSLFPQLSDGIKQPGPARKAAFSRHIVLQGEERRLGDALPRHGSSPCPQGQGQLPADAGHRHGPGTPGRAWGRWAAGGNGQKGMQLHPEGAAKSGSPGRADGIAISPGSEKWRQSRDDAPSSVTRTGSGQGGGGWLVCTGAACIHAVSLLLCITTAFSPYKTAVPLEMGLLQLRGASSESRIRLCCSVPPMCKKLGSSKGSLPPPRLCLSPHLSVSPPAPAETLPQVAEAVRSACSHLGTQVSCSGAEGEGSSRGELAGWSREVIVLCGTNDRPA